jgi:hypothetical protein
VLSADKTVNLVTHRLLFTVDRPTAGRETGDDQSPVQPRIRRDYPLNLSISVGGGKETNQNSLSNGE